MNQPSLAAIAAIIISLFFESAAEAQAYSVSFGSGLAPDYTGSDDYIAAPLPAFSYEAENLTVRSNGLGAEANLLRSEMLSLGPIVRFDPGRNDLFEVEDAIVGRLSSVDGSIELGAFVEGAVPLNSMDPASSLLTWRVSAVRGLDGGHEGVLVETSAGLVRFVGDWTMGANLVANFGSDEYTNAYFGLNSTDAGVSGLSLYEADGGLRDAGVGAFVGYELSDRWSVSTVMSFTRLEGDAANSPIVQERGDQDQGFLGFTFTFRSP